MNNFIYRPQHKPTEDLVRDFVIRLPEFRRVMDSIALDTPNESPQHLMIIGKRGMGKTTLLHRVRHEIETQHPAMVPVIFSEEQYQITKLFKLWEEIVYELDETRPEYHGMLAEVDAYDGDELEEFYYALIKDRVQTHQHRLVLLIDNLGVLIKKFTRREQQRLREILITFPGIKIIGASSAVLEPFYEHDQPFFEFFQTITLSTLDGKEVRTLLLTLDTKYPRQELERVIAEQPGRLEAMRILSGGVPRTMMLLFDILMDQQNGDSISDLYELLDRVTPLYKHRMDELPEQQQEIVHALALHWDGMATKEVVQKTKLPSPTVSAQLNALTKAHVVKATQSTGRNKFYQLEERFFNIWYLMHHAPRRDQKRVIWLTRFLEQWCGTPQSLGNSVSQFIEHLATGQLNPKYSSAMVTAYAGAKGLDTHLRDQLLITGKKVLGEVGESLPATFSEVYPEFQKHLAAEDVESAIQLLKRSRLPLGESYLLKGMIAEFQNRLLDAENLYQKSIDFGVQALGYLFIGALYHFKLKKFDVAIDSYHKAIEFGNSSTVYFLGQLYHVELKEFDKAIEYYEKGIELEHGESAFNLGLLYVELEDYEQAKEAYSTAIKLGNANAYESLADLLILYFDDSSGALGVLKQGIDQGYWHLITRHAIIAVFFNLKEEQDQVRSLLQSHRTALSPVERLFAIPLSWLWQDEPAEAKKELVELLPLVNDVELDSLSRSISYLVAMAILKEVPTILLKIFEDPKLGMKEKFKVHYYALMSLLKEEYPNAIRRMPTELEEPVGAVVEKIKLVMEHFSSFEEESQ